MQHLSLALYLPCWPSQMDNTARAHSVNTPLGIEAVLMVDVVVAGNAIVDCAVGGRAPGPYSAVLMTISGEAGSTIGSSGFPGTDWLHSWGAPGMSSLPDSMYLELFMISLMAASVEFVLYWRVWLLVGLLHFVHLSPCAGSIYITKSMLTWWHWMSNGLEKEACLWSKTISYDLFEHIWWIHLTHIFSCKLPGKLYSPMWWS